VAEPAGPTSDHRPGTRPATAADLADLARLVGRSRDHLAAERGGAVVLAREARAWPPEESLSADLEAPDTLVVVGTLGRLPVGHAVVTAETIRGGRLAVVRELFVEPEARGVGIGRRLMEDVVAWAVEADCDGVDALALPGDRATKNFFEGFGLVARTILVHRSLRPPP
jgi:GNAT superfamily N-acetyltransferase